MNIQSDVFIHDSDQLKIGVKRLNPRTVMFVIEGSNIDGISAIDKRTYFLDGSTKERLQDLIKELKRATNEAENILAEME